MVRFVQGQDNKVKFHIVSSITLTGFSLKVTFTSTPKTISNLTSRDYVLTFTSSEVSSITEDPMFGKVEVLDANGDTYQEALVEIQSIPEGEAGKAVGYNKVPITIAANWVGLAPDGGGGGDEYVKKSAFNGISNPKHTVNSTADTLTEVLNAVRGK